jgi:hypothetical protein
MVHLAKTIMKSQVPADFEKDKEYTLAVADSLPSDHYNFKPVVHVMTFAELVNHLAYSPI